MAMYRSRWLCKMQGREKKKKGQIRQSFGGEVEGLQRGFDWGEPSDLPMYPATTHQSRGLVRNHNQERGEEGLKKKTHP